jgi:hypothetical protein
VFATGSPITSDYDQGTPFCNNGQCCHPQSLWESHPYDENLTGLEDLAWPKGVKERVIRFAYSAEAEIVHVHQETWKGIYNRYRREGMAFKHINPEAHFSILGIHQALRENVQNDRREARCRRRLSQGKLVDIQIPFVPVLGTYRGYRRPDR